jgi:hypothetical protein
VNPEFIIGVESDNVAEYLIIRIPVLTLAFAAEHMETLGRGGDEAYQIKVKDKQEFAASVARILREEGEDGSNRVTRMFDETFKEVIEQGEDGPDYGPEDR